MIEVGRVCMKLAGRDAGKKCVVIEILENNLVLIDGATRRRKCNIAHLEPLKEKVDVSKGASHDAVKKALEPLGIEARETKPKQATEKPKKQPKKKAEEPKKAAKKPKAKKEAAPKAEKKETKASEKKAEPAKK